ncbi:PREDICTED: F-box/kelch-repeat protein SKIP4 [Camelina sativa]|uniref:F-box/kelch-repeat protein SKIP4 n=1 Tax=Camelina sativa TaxID=90675 RepID=A0ABM0SMJ4_CAMSA|nr:PREDICTED: F-box/kelch-repeat protein SKIP4 [Camelina sativa]
MACIVLEETERADQSNETQIALISGVPDDISESCLARVPREYHMAMKCVSRRWRDFVCSDEFCDYRKKFNLPESWIYALCRDLSGGVFLHMLNPFSSRRSWKRIHEYQYIPKREGMGFTALGKRLFMLGGCGWLEDATDEVYCYDAAMNTCCDVVPPLSTKRCYFACETVDGKIMAIGGLGLNPNAKRTWDIYDPLTRTCKSCSDANIVPEIEDSFVMDGKIYVRGGGSSTVVYNASSGVWETMEDVMASGWKGPAVVVADELYVLDQTFGTKLTMWCKDKRMWISIGKLSQLVMKQPCRLVSIGNSIFVIGKDCSTVVIDVENVRKTSMNGVMVCSSIPKTWDDDIDVISCKSVAI